MDEILHSPRSVGVAEPRPTLIEKWTQLRDALRTKASDLWQTVRPPLRAAQAWAERHPVSPLVYLAVSAVIGTAAVIGTVYTPSYMVTLDGSDIGVVADADLYSLAAASVEARASRILGYNYSMEHDVTFTPVLTKRSSGFSTLGQLETYLFNQVGEISDGYVLTVNNKTIGAADSRQALEDLLAAVAAPYCTEYTVDYSFVQEVKLTSDLITSDFNLDLEDMFEVLTENTTGETTYIVEKGDTYLGIARSYGMTLDELMALNPEASLNRLMIGDVLNIRKIIPYLSVRTVDNLTYNQVVESPIEYQDDPSMYIGDTKVITQGTDGEALVNANVTYVNGYETGRTVVTSTILVEPTVTVMARGTTERPKTASTGTYHWPIYGQINSPYGYRYLFGVTRLHAGIDIAASYGAAIAAADGGLVTFAGVSGGYGNLVVITHDNGTQTYYAHNSSLCVSVGERVYQGQTIARAGSTGNSTGVHCHFEIRPNGYPVDPRPYLA